jgi:hypothetical protein
MNTPSALTDWYKENQTALSQAIAHIRLLLQCHADPQTPHPTALHALPSSLKTLCQTFNLSSFECSLLLLCAGMELEADLASLCAAAQGNPQRPYVAGD